MAHFPVQFVFTFASSIFVGIFSALFAALTFKHLHLRDLSTANAHSHTVSLEISLMLVFRQLVQKYLLTTSIKVLALLVQRYEYCRANDAGFELHAVPAACMRFSFLVQKYLLYLLVEKYKY